MMALEFVAVTDDDVVAAAKAFGERIGKTCTTHQDVLNGKRRLGKQPTSTKHATDDDQGRY